MTEAALPHATDPAALHSPSRAHSPGLTRLPRSIWIPLLAMSVVAVGAFVFNEWSVKRIRAGDNELAALTAMQLDLVELSARLSDADAGTRSFLLSNEPADLQPFEDALKWMPIVGARLRVQTMNDAALLARVQSLESMRGQNVANLRAIVMLARQSRRTDAVELLRTGDGRLATNALRNESRGLLTELNNRVTALRRRTAVAVQWSSFAVAALGTLTLVLLVLAVRLLLKDFRRQEAARQEQATERQRLEQIVRERTAELSRLTTYLQTVSEQEKAELARDLHDELGGLLTAAKMDLAWLQGRASASEPEARDQARCTGRRDRRGDEPQAARGREPAPRAARSLRPAGCAAVLFRRDLQEGGPGLPRQRTGELGRGAAGTGDRAVPGRARNR